MGIHLADQTLDFLYACLLGAGLGALYDVFRILRVAFPPRKLVVFIQDILFFVLCAMTTFLYLLTAIDGVVRVFLIAGELLGAVLYYFTLGQFVMSVSKAIIEAVKKAIAFVVRYIFTPVYRLVYRIVALCARPFQYFGQIMKKSFQRLKFRLKVRRIVLYNHHNGFRMKKRFSREKHAHDTKKETE